MRTAGGPHHIGAGGVVFRVAAQRVRALHDRAHKPLCQRVREQKVLFRGEVALHRMHHDIDGAVRRLIGRQRVGQLGVQHRETLAREVVLTSAFEAAILVRDDAGVAHLASGGGDRQHAAHRQAGLGRGFAGVEIPDIPLVGYAVTDRLRRVDDAAAAHREQEVGFLAADEPDPFADL